MELHQLDACRRLISPPRCGSDYDSAEVQWVPSTQVDLDADGARRIFKLIDALEDSDDVQNVYANFDVSDEIMAAVG